MKILAVNHDVEDYERWKAAFDEFPPSMGGALFHRVNRNVENPNNVTVVAGFESLEQATAFRDDPELARVMERAGVNGRPRIEIYDEVEAVEY